MSFLRIVEVYESKNTAVVEVIPKSDSIVEFWPEMETFDNNLDIE